MNNPTISRRLFSLFCSLPVVALLQVSPAPAATSAEKFVEKVGGRVMAAARAGSVSSFRSVMRANASISTIAIYSLGPYRKKLPAGRKREYYGLVTNHISKVFAKHSRKLAGRSIKAVSSRTSGRSTIVKSKVKYPSGKSANVTWRLIKRGSTYKIFDVNVQGIWLASTQKTDFTSVLRRNGGDINALFSYLKK